MTNTCEKKFCDQYWVPKQMNRIKKMGHYRNSTYNKKQRKEKFPMKFNTLSKEKRETQKKCREFFCNPTCKTSILENGKTFSQSFKKRLKNVGLPVKNAMRSKKNIFGNRRTVLKNGFYEELDEKYVKNRKEKGAVSGCIMFPI
jgi:hypothetical protein